MDTAARKGISNVQLAKELEVTQRSAWFTPIMDKDGWIGRQHLSQDDPSRDK